MKIINDGSVREAPKHFGPKAFAFDLDTFQGLSGAPIFNESTGLVEGVFSSNSNRDFISIRDEEGRVCNDWAYCNEAGVDCNELGVAHSLYDDLMRIPESLK